VVVSLVEIHRYGICSPPPHIDRGSKEIEPNVCKHQTDDLARGVAALSDGDKGIEILYSEEKIICTGMTKAAKEEQKSMVPAQHAQRTNQERTPFICPL
jgi:hypothetical protein